MYVLRFDRYVQNINTFKHSHNHQTQNYIIHIYSNTVCPKNTE